MVHTGNCAVFKYIDFSSVPIVFCAPLISSSYSGCAKHFKAEMYQQGHFSSQYILYSLRTGTN